MKHGILILVLGALLFGTGCMQMEDHLTVNADGSGTWSYTIGLSAQLAAMAEQGGGEQDGPATTRADLEKMAAAVGGKVESFETGTKGGSKIYSGSISFPSIEKFVNSEIGTETGWTFRNHKGHLYAKLPSGMMPDGPGDKKETSEEEFNMMKGMMNGLKVSRSITLPNEIVNHNGAPGKGNTIKWEFGMNANTTKAAADNAGKVKPGAICPLDGIKFNLPLNPPPKAKPKAGGDGAETLEFNF
ncbi:MAG: hypothetical protein ACI8W8_004215 [Rhodothermales bacterium]|jgi:hypothetical protein